MYSITINNASHKSEFMFYFFIFLVGTILASALTCYWQRGWSDFCAYDQRSSCLNCGKILSYKQLIPIIGWLIQCGHCQNCGNAIHIIYPVMEIFGGLWALIIVLNTHCDTIQMAITIVIGILMMRLIFMDIMTYRVNYIYITAIAVIGFHYVGEWLTAMCLGTGFWLIKLLFQIYAKKNVLGNGDVKLAYAIGMWLSLDLIAPFCIVAGIMGILWSIIWYQQFKVKIFAFAPCLLLSFTCVYLYKIASSNCLTCCQYF